MPCRSISAGEWITASGEWVKDRTHGQRSRRFLRTSSPTSADGIEKYLSSGMIRGVGPVYAKKLVRAFGEKGFDVIETEPDRLREVDGVGPVRAASILAVFRVRGLLFNWQLCTTKTETAWKPLSKRKSGTARG